MAKAMFCFSNNSELTFEGKFTAETHGSGTLVLFGNFFSDKDIYPNAFGTYEDGTLLTLCGLVWKNRTKDFTEFDVLSYHYGVHDEQKCNLNRDFIGS